MSSVGTRSHHSLGLIRSAAVMSAEVRRVNVSDLYALPSDITAALCHLNIAFIPAPTSPISSIPDVNNRIMQIIAIMCNVLRYIAFFFPHQFTDGGPH
jgi:hypothetical protein